MCQPQFIAPSVRSLMLMFGMPPNVITHVVESFPGIEFLKESISAAMPFPIKFGSM